MPSTGYIATRKFTGETDDGPFSGPNVDYINSATDIEVEKIADGAEPNAGTILTKVDSDPGDTEYTLDSSGSLPEVLLGKDLDEGDVLKIRRKTTRGSREVDFVQGATLTEADLDKATKQGIYLAEESLDAAKDANDLYDVMSSGYTSSELPAVGGAGRHLLTVTVGEDVTWQNALPADSRTALGLGTAAEVDTGTTATSTIPLNTSSAALGTAAYVDTGTGVSDTPLNSQLGTASLLDTGTADGTIPVLTTGGALAAGISGVNLTNVNQAPRITIRHAYTADGDDTATGSAYALDFTTAKGVWYNRPLTDIIVHRINGASDSLGITIEDSGTGGADAEIAFTEVGTYLVTIYSTFFRLSYSTITRLVDLGGTPVGAPSPAIQGASAYSFNNTQTVASMGTGVINIGAYGADAPVRALHSAIEGERRFQLQWAVDKVINMSNYDDLLGDAFQTEIVGGSFVTNVFAWIDIVKISSEG